MRILLVQQYPGRVEEPVYPVGFHSIYNALQDLGDTHEISFLDMNKYDNPYNALSLKIEEIQPEVIGISQRNIDTSDSRDIFFYLPALEKTLSTIRKTTGAPIIVGGPAFSMYSAEIMLRYPLIDFGIFLEGEESFCELLNNFDKPDSVSGIFYRKGDVVKFSGGREFIELSESKPRLKYLVEPEEYGSQNFYIDCKRGCILNCAYCKDVILNNHQLRLRNVNSVLDEMEDLSTNRNTDTIQFTDPIFNIPLTHASEICEGILRNKLKIKWQAKFNERLIDSDFVKLAISSGCVLFSFSPDGYMNRTLDALGKDITKSEVIKSFYLARKNKGMNISLSFVQSPPDESLHGFIALMLFLLKLRIFIKIKRVKIYFGHLKVEPDTELFNMALKAKLMTEDQNFLPSSKKEMKKLFYRNPRTRYIDTILTGIHLLSKEIFKTRK